LILIVLNLFQPLYSEAITVAAQAHTINSVYLTRIYRCEAAFAASHIDLSLLAIFVAVATATILTPLRYASDTFTGTSSRPLSTLQTHWSFIRFSQHTDIYDFVIVEDTITRTKSLRSDKYINKVENIWLKKSSI
jgi:hypothetical protein